MSNDIDTILAEWAAALAEVESRFYALDIEGQAAALDENIAQAVADTGAEGNIQAALAGLQAGG